MSTKRAWYLAFTLLAAAAPATKPSTTMYGAVTIRADAPQPVHDYFGLIPKCIAARQAAVDAANAAFQDGKGQKSRGGRGGSPSNRESAVEAQKRMAVLREDVEKAKASLEVAESPDFRPTIGADPAINGSIVLADSVRVLSIHDDTHFMGSCRDISGDAAFQVSSTNGLVDGGTVGIKRAIVRAGAYAFESATGRRTVPLYREIDVDPEAYVVK